MSNWYKLIKFAQAVLEKRKRRPVSQPAPQVVSKPQIDFSPIESGGNRGYWIAPDGKIFGVPYGDGHGGLFRSIRDYAKNHNLTYPGNEYDFDNFKNAGYIRVVNETNGTRMDRFTQAIDMGAKPTSAQLDVLFKIFSKNNFRPVYLTIEGSDVLAEDFEEMFNLLTSPKWPPVDVSQRVRLDQDDQDISDFSDGYSTSQDSQSEYPPSNDSIGN